MFVFPRRLCRILLLSAAPLVVACGVFWPRSAAADSDSDRIARLEKQVLELETRLAKAERRTRAESKAAAASVQKNQPAAAVAAAPAAAAAPSPGEAQSQPEKQPAKDLTPSEFNVFRDTAATLSQNKGEASIGLNYQKRSSALQSDRAAQGFANFRYGILDGVEASVNIPYYLSTRTTQIGQGQTHDDRMEGIGDISGQISAIAIKETTDWPALVATASLSAPTGRNPITFGTAYFLGGNPTDPFRNYQSVGNWVPGVFGQLYKTLDPIIVFAGAGLQYPLPQTLQGHKIRYSPQFLFNIGFAFAVNEKTTIGLQLNNSYQANYHIDGVMVKQTEQEPILARFVVVQRIAMDTYIEPSVAFGLSRDSPDAVIGVTLRRRY